MNSKTGARRRRLLCLMMAKTVAASLMACGGGGGGSTGTDPAPAPTGASVASVSTSAMNFAPVVVGGTAASQRLTVSNSGTAPLVVSSNVSSSSAFLTVGSTCTANASIPAGGSCTIDIAFAPSIPGAIAATLLVSHNATPSTSVVSLSAFATAAELPAGPRTALTAADCPRLVSGDQAIAALAIHGADMQQVADILKTTNSGHAYRVFARAPLNVMWWLRSQGGLIDMATIGAAVHESNHEIDFALTSRCNTDHVARLLFDGVVQTTAVVSGNGSTANYSIAAETVPPALKTGLRYSTYVPGAASAPGNDFSVLIDELNAYTGATEFELGLLSDPVYKVLRTNGDFNAGGQVDFMLYALAYLKAARLNHPSTYASIRSQAATLAYIQKVWTQAEVNLAGLYPYTVISGTGKMVVSKDTLAAAYSPEFIAELDFLAISHQSSGAWLATYLH